MPDYPSRAVCHGNSGVASEAARFLGDSQEQCFSCCAIDKREYMYPQVCNGHRAFYCKDCARKCDHRKQWWAAPCNEPLEEGQDTWCVACDREYVLEQLADASLELYERDIYIHELAELDARALKDAA